MKLENIDGLLLCSKCENQLRVEVYHRDYPFFQVYPCVHCFKTGTDETNQDKDIDTSDNPDENGETYCNVCGCIHAPGVYCKLSVS